jgi:hypothetical protein
MNIFDEEFKPERYSTDKEINIQLKELTAWGTALFFRQRFVAEKALP